jgi:WD40 repeat protein
VEQEFTPAHGQPVLCVSTQSNSEVFVSCADSKEVLVWDPRLEKAAHSKLTCFFYFTIFKCFLSVVFQTEINTTCVDWQPGGPVLAIGDQAGNVYLADSRSPKTQLAEFSIPAHRPVHKILYNKNW